MKNPLKSLVAVALLAGFSIAAHAQAPMKLLVVDMAKLYDNHYKTVDYNAKIQADDAKAQEEVGRLQKELNDLVNEYKAFHEKNAIEETAEGNVVVKNPMLSEDAKRKILDELRNKRGTIQAKQNEGQQFVGQTQQTLRQRLQTFRSVMLEEISKSAAEIAKRKGATLLIDKAGPTLIGIPAVLHVDASYDITDEVLKELNKDRPATSAAPAAAGGAAAPAAAPGTPSLSLPGATKK